jgi:putative restriction endonuclease
MFDRGLLSIADNGKILIAEKLIPEAVKRMLNPIGMITFPANPAAYPHPQFLRFHRETIFKG